MASSGFTRFALTSGQAAALIGPVALDAARAGVVGFHAKLEQILAATQQAGAERDRRAAAATIAFQNRTRYVLLEYQPGAECPPDGPFAFVWRDLFAQAQRNLAELAANVPDPAVETPRDVLTWARLINWNVAILLNATNIRGRFLFPTSTIASPPDPGSNCRASTTQTMSYQAGPGDTRLGRDGACAGVPQDLVESGNGVAVNDPTQRAFVATSLGGARPPGALVPGDGLSPPQYGGGFAPWALIDLAVNGSARPGTTTTIVAPIAYSFIDGETQAATTVEQLLAKWQRTRATVPFGWQYGFADMAWRGAGWDPPAWVQGFARVARAYAGANLDVMLAEALAFYTLNHVPYWSGRGINVIDPALLAAMQRASMYAASQGTAGIGLSIGSGIASAVGGPVAGAIAGAIGQLGQILFVELIGGALAPRDGPTFLFLRSPAGCRAATTAEEIERALASAQADRTRRAPPPAPAAIDNTWLERNVAPSGIPIAGVRVPPVVLGGLAAAAIAGVVLVLAQKR